MLINQLESELSSLQRRHEATIQEIGRFEAKLKTNEMDFKHEIDCLNSEVPYLTLIKILF